MLKSFGKLPSGRRLDRMHKSVHYREGSFHNLVETRMLAEGASYLRMVREYFRKAEGREPLQPLPSVKTDLKSISATYPVIIWLGHSSYLIKINDKKILVDPVFNDTPSPIAAFGKRGYPISTPYELHDLPEIDFVIITHDHYDHLDYKTIRHIHPGVKQFFTGLGVGEHLEYWGVSSQKIIELDWWESANMMHGMELIASPARHFSGRLFRRNATLWCSFILKTSTHSLFLGGDSGYDGSFKTIGTRYGPFDIAVLECGQYNDLWPYIHMMPEEAVQAAMDLRAKAFLPVHWGRFTLAWHSWKDPIERAVKQAEAHHVAITTPCVGEPVILDQPLPESKWWESLI